MAASAAVAAARQRDVGGSVFGGTAVAAASAAVTTAQSTAAEHIATAAAWWQQRGGCGGFTGTVRECADAQAFERHQRSEVLVFVIGQGRRDDSADGIVVGGSDDGARGDVHRGRQCAAAAVDDAPVETSATVANVLQKTADN